MRRILLGLAVLLIAVPAAGAREFEMERATGDVIFRASANASVMIEEIGPGARIIGPAAMTESIACVEPNAVLQRCTRIRRTSRGTEWRVLRAVRIWHQQEDPYLIVIRGAPRLETVVISGCGTMQLRGTGSYSADGADEVSYTHGDRVTVKLVP